MKRYRNEKIEKRENFAGKKRCGKIRDIFIAARLAALGFIISSANALFNFIYFDGQKKIKVTYPVRVFNKFINRCALTFNKLEDCLSFRQKT